MFDLSDDLEVKVLKDMGPQKKSVVVIDVYKIQFQDSCAWTLIKK